LSARESTPGSIEPGSKIDGFVIGERVHAGAMGTLYRVSGSTADFPMVMKVPRIRAGESEEALINFETEVMIMPALVGPHVPRFVAAGDLARRPYVVTEWVEGESLEAIRARGALSFDDVARLGAALADAVHSLHQQDTIHFDLKPDNAIVRPSGEITLIDFGLSCHANFPDLLAEEKRFAAGSAPYISPEQVLGTRDDARSDLFALGVVLYELTTEDLPFGVPATMAGMGDRLWLGPVPPKARRAGVPPWLQEVILRCLEPDAAERYQSAAHVAFDLRHPDQVKLTARASKSDQDPFFVQLRRWWRMRNRRHVSRRMPKMQVGSAPVIMVAVDTRHPEDERQPVLRRVTAQMLSLSAEFRLVCVSVIRAGPGAQEEGSSGTYLEHLVRLRHWVEPLRLPVHRLSLHVIESATPAGALLDYARSNHVDLIVLGAPGPSQQTMAWWRSVASSVTANATCSVHVVRVPAQTGG
jgi:eukaryotic-like serine/threonine-protein kinase